MNEENGKRFTRIEILWPALCGLTLILFIALQQPSLMEKVKLLAIEVGVILTLGGAGFFSLRQLRGSDADRSNPAADEDIEEISFHSETTGQRVKELGYGSYNVIHNRRRQAESRRPVNADWRPLAEMLRDKGVSTRNVQKVLLLTKQADEAELFDALRAARAGAYEVNSDSDELSELMKRG